jgi:hypothetical protein
MIFVQKSFLDGLAKRPCNSKGKPQVRLEPALLDGVDRLTSDADFKGEFGLRPLPLSPQHTQPSFHKSHGSPFKPTWMCLAHAHVEFLSTGFQSN